MSIDLQSIRSANQMLDAFHGESDRGAVLVATGYLEEQLKVAIKARLQPGRGLDALLPDKEFGPLSTFEARAAACHALGIIDDYDFRELKLIRKVRNELAHKWDVSLDDPKISDWCRELCSKPIEEDGKPLRTKSITPRDNFVLSAVSLLAKLMRAQSS
ncbi:hypothetical protein [Leisingera sp. M523]|uniref:hypothetical protein n=1 Tax=Leisingera sp. M523 TaxID=2867013 RepID=UPI0021A74AA2|nr:hypothetical protein [Leisingera sp. M523]UWQ29935.1 hypothetical protein K3557_05135 [Leisingera sp. M523]